MEEEFHYTETDEYRRAFSAGCFGCMWTLVAMALMALLSLLLAGCTTTKYVTAERHTTDTLRIIDHQRDSIYMHDSIYVSERGDTVKIERWHTQYRDRWQTDTIWQSRVDSVGYPILIEKKVEVPRELTATQKGFMGAGMLSLVVVFIGIAMKLKKYLP